MFPGDVDLHHCLWERKSFGDTISEQHFPDIILPICHSGPYSPPESPSIRSSDREIHRRCTWWRWWWHSGTTRTYWWERMHCTTSISTDGIDEMCNYKSSENQQSKGICGLIEVALDCVFGSPEIQTQLCLSHNAPKGQRRQKGITDKGADYQTSTQIGYMNFLLFP